MKKFDFLIKPIFFIFSLLFATWLVIRIEEISPSDFGQPESSSGKKPDYVLNEAKSKQYLQNLCNSYKAGTLDSTKLDENLGIFLKSFKTACSE